jgi:hypothetical protein
MSGLRVPVGVKKILFSYTPAKAVGSAQGTGVLFWEVKRPGHGVEHSPSFTAKVKNEWIYTSFPPTCLYGADGENYVL